MYRKLKQCELDTILRSFSCPKSFTFMTSGNDYVGYVCWYFNTWTVEIYNNGECIFVAEEIKLCDDAIGMCSRMIQLWKGN